MIDAVGVAAGNSAVQAVKESTSKRDKNVRLMKDSIVRPARVLIVPERGIAAILKGVYTVPHAFGVSKLRL
jgi:hypothetical protein